MQQSHIVRFSFILTLVQVYFAMSYAFTIYIAFKAAYVLKMNRIPHQVATPMEFVPTVFACVFSNIMYLSLRAVRTETATNCANALSRVNGNRHIQKITKGLAGLVFGLQKDLESGNFNAKPMMLIKCTLALFSGSLALLYTPDTYGKSMAMATYTIITIIELTQAMKLYVKYYTVFMESKLLANLNKIKKEIEAKKLAERTDQRATKFSKNDGFFKGEHGGRAKNEATNKKSKIDYRQKFDRYEGSYDDGDYYVVQKIIPKK